MKSLICWRQLMVLTCVFGMLVTTSARADNESIQWGQTITQFEGIYGFAEATPSGVDLNAVGAPLDGETAYVRRDFTVASTLPLGTPVQVNMVVELACDPGNAYASLEVFSNNVTIYFQAVSGGGSYLATNTLRLEVGRPYRLIAQADMVTTDFGEADATVTFLTPVLVNLDLVAQSLTWNTNQGGVDFNYCVTNGTLNTATTVKLFWANGTTTSNILTNAPIFTNNIPAGFSGQSATTHVDSSAFASPPGGATHVLLVIDPDNLVTEASEANNLLSLPLASIPPVIDIKMIGSNVILSWPTNDPLFSLLVSTNLLQTSWIPHPNSPFIVNGRFTITNAIGQGNRFYRLQK